MFIASGLSYSENNVSIFQGLGFCLPPGSLLELTASNTALPTLVLEILAGRSMPAVGHITLDGTTMRRIFFNSFKRHMLYLGSKSPAPRADWTVKQIITECAKRGGAAQLAKAAMHYFDLDELQEHRFGDLPPAFQQRVILTSLLAIPRPIWLLENPTQHLNQDGKALLYGLIANRCNQNGIVIVAHMEPGGIAPIQTLNLQDFT